MKSNIITGLDIGTHSIKALVAQKKGSDWEVLSYAEMPSFGLRKGAVVNIEETAKNVQMIVSGIEKDCNRRISSAFVNIGGNHLYVTPSDGIISVSRADQRISKEDVERVLQATRAINIASKNDEILDVIPREFIIDDQKGIKEPENLTGIRLEAKVLLLCYFQPYFTNLTQAVLNSKLQINDVIPSPLAAANAVLTSQQKELGVALIDIGAATTSLAVFEEGQLMHLAIFPIGSANITNDIAIGLKTEVAIAEAIKKQHGTCMFAKTEKDQKNQSKKKIEVFDRSSTIDFTKKDLVDIIEPRVSEILDLVQKELKKINRQELLPGGVVLTGGGAKIPKIKELTKEILKLSCEIGTPKGIIGLQDDPALATVVGLALEGVDSGAEEGILGGAGKISSIFKKILRAFKP
ncbi:MAG: cell division protein FtsA [Candidatus Staskawiczbacteria bacterium]|nr:cell division protein FtsA [Candidatus Staskawiczbacteria bacterium]